MLKPLLEQNVALKAGGRAFQVCTAATSPFLSAFFSTAILTLFMVVARSECAALRRGTLCRQNCVPLLYVFTLSANN